MLLSLLIHHRQLISNTILFPALYLSFSLSHSLSPPLSSPSLLHAHSLCLFFSFLLSLLHTLSHSLFLSFTLFISPSEYKKTSPFTHLLGALRKSAMKDLVLSTLICQVSSISNFCIILGSFFSSVSIHFFLLFARFSFDLLLPRIFELLMFVCLSVRLSICLCLLICVTVCMPRCLSSYLFVYMSI